MAKVFTSKFFSLLLVLLLSLVFSSSIVAQQCSSYTFSTHQTFSSCSKLPVLNSFLHWTYIPSTKTVNLAYRHTNISSSRWVAWAINPNSKGMLGSQAIVAYKKPNGLVHAYTSPITQYTTSLAQGNLTFPVSDVSAVFENNEMIIFATLVLPSNTSTVNHVWQEGPIKEDGSLGMHALTGPNLKSMGSLDFMSGKIVSNGGTRTKKYVHGALTTVSWGIMMPIGVIAARYLKVMKPVGSVWFYIHIYCQSSAYLIGVGGWAMGLVLGSESPGIQYNAHRNIGIALFCLGTLQVLALLVRPKPEHRYRRYWELYHRATGYAVIVLTIINILKGFDMLDADKIWKQTYIGIISALGGIAAVLEAFTWILRVLKKRNESSESNSVTEVDSVV